MDLFPEYKNVFISRLYLVNKITMIPNIKLMIDITTEMLVINRSKNVRQTKFFSISKNGSFDSKHVNFMRIVWLWLFAIFGSKSLVSQPQFHGLLKMLNFLDNRK